MYGDVRLTREPAAAKEVGPWVVALLRSIGYVAGGACVVRLCTPGAVECEVDEAVDELLLAQSNGYIREIMNGLAAIERLGKAEQTRVDLALIGGRKLIRGVAGTTAEAAL